MNTLHIHKVLTNHVKYFQGVYTLDRLLCTLIKPSIIVIKLDKKYIPGSHWVAVCFPTPGTLIILIRTGYHHSNLKSWHTCNATQFLGYLTSTYYRVNVDFLRTLLLIVRPPQSQGTTHEVIRQHVCICSLHLQR